MHGGGSLDSPTTILFGLAILVLVAKAAGLLARQLGQPAVLGELLAGICLANTLPRWLGGDGIEFMRTNPTLRVLGEIGVLILMFDVGLESDLRALRRVGFSAFLVATIGVAAPFILGWLVASELMPQAPAVAHVFVGASLTATSVGITARVLKDLGAIQSVAGQTILGAALLDDIIGLVILAVVTGMASGGDQPGVGDWSLVPWILAHAILLLGFAAVGGHLLSAQIAAFVGRLREPGLFLPLGLAICFIGAGVAEWMGLAGILGAFAAGMLLDPYGEDVIAHGEDHSLAALLRPLASVFVPLFFVLAGVQVDLSVLASASTLMLGGALLLVALVGKLLSGLGVLGRNQQRWVVAVGMVPRGEVGLIFATIGATTLVGGRPLLPPELYSALVLVVLVTTLVTPVVLSWLVRHVPVSQLSEQPKG